MSLNRLVPLLQQLSDESITWEKVLTRFPVVRVGGEDEDEESVGIDDNQDKKMTVVEGNRISAPTVVESTFRGLFSRPNPALLA